MSIATSLEKLKNALDDSKKALSEKLITPSEDLKFSEIAKQIEKIKNKE